MLRSGVSVIGSGGEPELTWPFLDVCARERDFSVLLVRPPT